jgi:hypothetical protein
MAIATNDLLAAALVGLYFQNCFKGITFDQRILQIYFGRIELYINSFTLGGRNFVILNPLLPFLSSYITHPFRIAEFEDKNNVFKRPADSAILLRIAATIQFSLVIVLAPLSLILHRDAWFLMTAVLSYLNYATMAWFFWTDGRAAEIPKSKLRGLLLEAFFCLPYSANLLRNFTLLIPYDQDLYSVFFNLPKENQTQYVLAMLDYLDDQLNNAENESNGRAFESRAYVIGLSNE